MNNNKDLYFRRRLETSTLGIYRGWTNNPRYRQAIDMMIARFEEYQLLIVDGRENAAVPDMFETAPVDGFLFELRAFISHENRINLYN